MKLRDVLLGVEFFIAFWAAVFGMSFATVLVLYDDPPALAYYITYASLGVLVFMNLLLDVTLPRRDDL